MVLYTGFYILPPEMAALLSIPIMSHVGVSKCDVKGEQSPKQSKFRTALSATQYANPHREA